MFSPALEWRDGVMWERYSLFDGQQVFGELFYKLLRHNWYNIILPLDVQHNHLIFVYATKWWPHQLTVIIIHSYRKLFFLVMRTVKTYSLSSFPMCNTVLIVVTITSWLIYFIIESLYILIPSPISPTHISVRACTIGPYVSDLLHLA